VTRGPIAEDDLHAAADDRLPPGRAEAVRRNLAEDPLAAEQVAFYRRLNEGLHRLYDPLLAEPVPPGLRERLAENRVRRRVLLGLGRAAAVAALLVAGAAGGWLARDRLGADGQGLEAELPRLAADAHLVYAVEVRHPVEVGAEQEAHLVQWLTKRLGAEVRAPSLLDKGYRLIGGRLLPAGDGVAGQFMYEDTAGTRLTLFLAAGGDRSDTAFRFVEENGVSVFYWRDGDLGYALSAELPRDRLLAICNEVYAQLNPDAEPVRW